MACLGRLKIAAILVFILANSAMAGIYNNSGTTAEDSICFVGVNISADGRRALPVTVASDSLYVLVFYPGGALAFRDSCLMNDAKITIAAFEDQAAVSGFSYKNAVASVDGGGQNGTYKVIWSIRDVDSANTTFGISEAQVYTTNNLSEKLDSITQVPDGEITASGIAADAIGASEIATDAIGAAEIAASALTTAEIATGAISADEIADNAIDAGAIAADAITSSEIATSAIDFGVELDTGGLGASGWAHGTRTLTALDEDATTLDMNATTIGTVTNLTNNNPNLDGATGTLSDAQIDLLTVTFLNDSLRTMYNKLLNDSTVTQARLDSLIKLGQAIASANEVNPNASFYFVTKQGNDANNGKSWATAFLTTQEALETVNNSGDSLRPQYIFIGPGTWTLADADTILYRNVHLIGSGYERTTIYNSQSGGSDVVVLQIGDTVGGTSVNNAAHCEIAGIAFVNALTTTGSDGIWINRGDSVHIHDCMFSNVYQGIFNRAGNKSSYIHDNVFRQYGHDGIVTNGQFDRIYNNVVFADTLEAAAADGIGANGRHGIYYNNIVVCSLTAFGTGATQSKRNVFANNFAYSTLDGGGSEFAYQYLVGDNHFLVGNWSQSKLQTAMGLNPADSGAAIQDEIYALYAKQHLDSLAGTISDAQVDELTANIKDDDTVTVVNNVLNINSADTLARVNSTDAGDTLRDHAPHGDNFASAGAMSAVWTDTLKTLAHRTDSLMRLSRPDSVIYRMMREVWRNQDTTNADTSNIGKWLANNIVNIGIDTVAVVTSVTNKVTLVDSSANDLSMLGSHHPTDSANQVAIKLAVEELQAFLGACDECYYRLFPEGGTANKDSAIVIDGSVATSDSLLGKIIYKHGSVNSVYDTAYFYTRPWW